MKYDLKQIFEDDPYVLLNTEDFHHKVTANMTLYQLITYRGVPTGYSVFVVEGVSHTIFKVRNEPGFTSIEDCFSGLKCLCLNEEKAQEVYEIFRHRCKAEARF